MYLTHHKLKEYYGHCQLESRCLLPRGKLTEVMRTSIPSGQAPTLFLTDPPYNIGHKYGSVSDRLAEEDYHAMIKHVLESSYEVAADSAHFFMIHYPEALAEMWAMIKETGWKFRQWLTWVYPSNIGMSKRAWTRASRTVLWLVKDEEYIPHSIQTGSSGPTETHGTRGSPN